MCRFKYSMFTDYLEGNFISKMNEYLVNLDNDDKEIKYPYFDIDTNDGETKTGEWQTYPLCPDYYNELSSYLNSIESNKMTANYQFVQPIPYKDKYWENKDQIPGGIYSDGSKIAVIDKEVDKPLFLLTSDVFGFSAVNKVFFGSCVNSKKGCYPYGALYQLSKKTEDFEKNCEFISKCIYDTRTLGGAFLWPTLNSYNGNRWIGEKRTNPYNAAKGVNSYIEDRVDLTLLEIKHYYDVLKKTSNIKEIILCKQKEYPYDILPYFTNIAFCLWLEMFGSFEGFIDALSFRPFVVKDDENKYHPIDIIESDLGCLIGDNINEKYGLFYGCEYIENKIEPTQKHVSEDSLAIVDASPKEYEITNMYDKSPKEYEITNMYDNNDINGIKKMLDNVRLLTIERTRLMYESIKSAPKAKEK